MIAALFTASWLALMENVPVLMRRATGKKHHDDRLVGTTNARGGLSGEQLWQRKATEAQRANLEKVSA